MKLRWRWSGKVSRDEARSLWRAMREFRPTLADQGRPIALSLGLTLLAVAVELLRPWPVRFLLDGVLLRDPESTAPAVVPWLTSKELLLACCIAVLLIAIAIGCLGVWRSVVVGHIGRKVTTRIRSRVHHHLHRLALPYHKGSQTGDLLVRLMGDVNLMRDLLFTAWASILERSLLFIGTVVWMSLIDWRLTLVALAPLPFLFVGLRRSSTELTKVSRKQRRKEGSVAAMASESLRQIEVVKAYAAEDRTARAFTKQARSSERAGLRAIRIAAGMNRTSEIATGIGLALVLYLGAMKVLDGVLDPGVLIVLVSYARSLYKPVRKLSREGVRLSKATACAGRLLEVLQEPVESSNEGRSVERLRGEIELEGVTKDYEDGTEALRGVDAHVPAGSLALVSGPNGAGKSTLVSLLLRLLEPTSGTVRVDGVPIGEWKLEDYRGRVAYVPQDLLLFGGTVRENLRFARPEASDEDVEEAAAMALADDFIRDFPEGYETELGEAGARLSGGQARRLMLARAALRDADILLLDEPLAGLDPEARALVARGIRGIAAGRTTIVVSHGSASELDPDVHLRFDAGRCEVETVAVADRAVRPERGIESDP